MNSRIAKLSNNLLVALTLRALQNLDNAMTRYGESGENPYGFGGALSFGWDYPTAAVIFPRLARRFHVLKEEGKLRGLERVKYTARRLGRGKIVYSLVA